MDVLHIGNASGLGGLSVWEEGNRLPLMTPGGKGDEDRAPDPGPGAAVAGQVNSPQGQPGNTGRLEMSA
jgi:hypothetical protein